MNLTTTARLLMVGAILTLGLLAGCSEETLVSPDATTDLFVPSEAKDVDRIQQDGSYVPVDQVTVDCFGKDLTFWPFTSTKLDGSPVDPIHLVFAGNADPLQIRAALLGLDGDRSALGLPDVYPLNQVWKDAIGGSVQSNWAEDGGWLGSVVQLTLGDYDPIRFHLRLFRTSAMGPNGERYTLGAAHFEVLIPGTTDHQVLSWSLAKDIVVGDLMRTGLLDPSQHLMPSQPITPTPTFREIIPFIYNELPDELIAIIDGPPKPVEAPVGIDNGDGTAMMVYLAGAAPVTPGTYATTVSVGFDQYVPRPYCTTGPGDWLYITGPVDFQTTVTVDEYGTFSYQQSYLGWLDVLPIDMGTGMPAGDPFQAKVDGRQGGWMNATGARVQAHDTKMTHDDVGPQMSNPSLKIGEWNKAQYKDFTRCFDD